MQEWGIPSGILTDKGSNFTSQLLTELSIQSRSHSIIHKRMVHTIERFNQTLKSMLQEVATKEENDLRYGKSVRGSPDVLRESWEVNAKIKESVVSYVRDKLDTMFSLVDDNLIEAQKVQKSWYYRKVCH